MSTLKSEDQIALFLDVENLVVHAGQQGISFSVEPIVRRARQEGRLAVARAYGDFSLQFMAPVLADLQRSVFELIQLPTNARGKNTADMLLALDALEMCLHASAPGTIVIGAGDRDYVPLVQRLKRYGMRAIGVGLQGSISAMLRTICDDYWYYEDLAIAGFVAPSLTAPTERETVDSVDEAVRLLVSVVRDVEEQVGSCLLSRACEAMQQRVPGFQHRSFGYPSFKEFAAEAERRGLVRLTTHGTVVHISARDLASDMPPPSEEEAVRRLCNTYRGVLEHKKVPLVAWEDRSRLIKALWKEFEQAEQGMSIQELSGVLQMAAVQLGLAVSEPAIYKMTYTLNLGRCFQVDGAPRFVEDIFNQTVFPACDVDEALDRMHVTYVRGIALDRPDLPLRADAVARLLFGDPTPTQVVLAQDYIRKALSWRDY